MEKGQGFRKDATPGNLPLKIGLQTPPDMPALPGASQKTSQQPPASPRTLPVSWGFGHWDAEGETKESVFQTALKTGFIHKPCAENRTTLLAGMGSGKVLRLTEKHKSSTAVPYARPYSPGQRWPSPMDSPSPLRRLVPKQTGRLTQSSKTARVEENAAPSPGPPPAPRSTCSCSQAAGNPDEGHGFSSGTGELGTKLLLRTAPDWLRGAQGPFYLAAQWLLSRGQRGNSVTGTSATLLQGIWKL